MKTFNDSDMATFISILDNTRDIYIKIDKDSITPDMNLKNDLGIDSLGKVNLYYEISDLLETDDDEEETLNWKLVRDVLVYINENADDSE